MRSEWRWIVPPDQGCEYWVDDAPCARPVVETLVNFNPLCGGQGHFAVCAGHLDAHLRNHLLEVDRAG